MKGSVALDPAEEGVPLQPPPGPIRRSSTGFSSKLSTFTDQAAGVTFTAAYETVDGTHMPPKVLKYDAHKVLATSSPWRALCSQARHASALTGKEIGKKVLGFSMLGGICTALGVLAEAPVEDALNSLNTLLAGGLLFLLGPFTGQALNRWWAIRKDCIGKLWSACNNLSAYAAAWFWRPTGPDRAARELTKRYGLASHALLWKRARNELHDLSDLVNCGLLLEEEIAILAPLPSKAQVVWAWQTHMWTRALAGDLGCSPCPNQAFGVAMKEVMEARHAIGVANTYIETQQPYPYVHLLSMITDVALLVNAMAVGVHTGRQISQTGYISMMLLVAVALVRVSAFTLVYNGLLGIGIALDNPLGHDPSDLPGLAYQDAMKCECDAFGTAVDAAKGQDWFLRGFEEKRKE